MSRRVWEAVETKAGKTRMVEINKKERKQEEKEQKKKEENKKKKRPKRERMMEVKRIAEEWKIWDKEEEAAKLEEAKKLILEHFCQWIHVFGKKQSKRMLMKKI